MQLELMKTRSWDEIEPERWAEYDEVVVPLADPPPGSTFKGYEDFVVQDLLIRPRVIRYRRERWQTPDGQHLVAGLPADVRPDSHFGPNLICFIIHQYHHQHVTQPLLWEQLDQLGRIGSSLAAALRNLARAPWLRPSADADARSTRA